MLRVRLTLVLGGLVFSSLMGVVATMAWIANKPGAVDLSPAIPRGRAVAEAAAQDYLTGRPFSVPVGSQLDQYTNSRAGTAFPFQSLTWDSFRAGRFYTGESTEEHRFLVTYKTVDANNLDTFRRMTLTVLVVVPAAGSGTPVYLASLPSLLPDLSATKTGPALYYDSSISQAPPAQVTETLTDWAKAYAADDRKTLQQLSGDTDTGFEYRGLGGFGVDNVTVTSSVPLDKALTSFLVQVRIQMTAAADFRQETDLELTVIGADSATPHVQGWGPIGVGPVAAHANRVPKA